jgi:Bacterial membrane flanked domain.
MNYLLEHLPKGERPIAKTRKSLCIFIRDIFFLLVIAGGAAATYFWLHVPPDNIIFLGCVGGLLLIWLCLLGANVVKFMSSALLVTTHKFMYKEDLISIKLFDSQLANIDSVEVEYKTVFHRLFNYGQLVISTHATKHTFNNIAKPDLFSARLNKQASRVADSRIRRVHVTFGVGPSSQPSPANRLCNMAPVKAPPGKKVKQPVSK